MLPKIYVVITAFSIILSLLILISEMTFLVQLKTTPFAIMEEIGLSFYESYSFLLVVLGYLTGCAYYGLFHLKISQYYQFSKNR